MLLPAFSLLPTSCLPLIPLLPTYFPLAYLLSPLAYPFRIYGAIAAIFVLLGLMLFALHPAHGKLAAGLVMTLGAAVMVCGWWVVGGGWWVVGGGGG